MNDRIVDEGDYVGLIVSISGGMNSTNNGFVFVSVRVYLSDCDRTVLVNLVGTVGMAAFILDSSGVFIGKSVRVRLKHRKVNDVVYMETSFLPEK